MFDWQTCVALAIVAGAVFYVLRTFFASNNGSSSCGSCSVNRSSIAENDGGLKVKKLHQLDSRSPDSTGE